MTQNFLKVAVFKAKWLSQKMGWQFILRLLATVQGHYQHAFLAPAEALGPRKHVVLPRSNTQERNKIWDSSLIRESASAPYLQQVGSPHLYTREPLAARSPP